MNKKWVGGGVGGVGVLGLGPWGGGGGGWGAGPAGAKPALTGAGGSSSWVLGWACGCEVTETVSEFCIIKS